MKNNKKTNDITEEIKEIFTNIHDSINFLKKIINKYKNDQQ